MSMLDQYIVGLLGLENERFRKSDQIRKKVLATAELLFTARLIIF